MVIGEGEHQLQFPYALWFSKRPPGKQQFNYEDNIKLVGRFASVRQTLIFSCNYSNLNLCQLIISSSNYFKARLYNDPAWLVETFSFHPGKSMQ